MTSSSTQIIESQKLSYLRAKRQKPTEGLTLGRLMLNTSLQVDHSEATAAGTDNEIIVSRRDIEGIVENIFRWLFRNVNPETIQVGRGHGILCMLDSSRFEETETPHDEYEIRTMALRLKRYAPSFFVLHLSISLKRTPTTIAAAAAVPNELEQGEYLFNLDKHTFRPRYNHSLLNKKVVTTQQPPKMLIRVLDHYQKIILSSDIEKIATFSVIAPTHQE